MFETRRTHTGELLAVKQVSSHSLRPQRTCRHQGFSCSILRFSVVNFRLRYPIAFPAPVAIPDQNRKVKNLPDPERLHAKRDGH
jgi:hypothetical protein